MGFLAAITIFHVVCCWVATFNSATTAMMMLRAAADGYSLFLSPYGPRKIASMSMLRVRFDRTLSAEIFGEFAFPSSIA
ncbi:hypothetical protein Trydic_g20047 [Trypoxylus dichotomus]